MFAFVSEGGGRQAVAINGGLEGDGEIVDVVEVEVQACSERGLSGAGDGGAEDRRSVQRQLSSTVDANLPAAARERQWRPAAFQKAEGALIAVSIFRFEWYSGIRALKLRTSQPARLAIRRKPASEKIQKLVQSLLASS